MFKNALKGLSVILGVLFLFGCTATKDIKVRRYIEVKDRVDQSMEEGNAGFITGDPQPEDRSGIRKTRKIYVLEVSKGSEGAEEEVVIDGEDAVMEESDFQEEGLDYDAEETMEILDLGSEDSDATVEPSPSVVEYTVQKDDTLQKISKKFYDSYSQWPKIYEMNKNVISDPDRIKPGIVIQVPME